MELERRDFLKAVTSGLALGAYCFEAMGQSPGSGTNELLTGSGTVHLEGKLKAGNLTLDAHDFLDHKSQGLIVRGKLDQPGSKSLQLYSAMFNHENDLRVFAVFQDSGALTTAVFTSSDDPQIGRLVVWNDNQTPQVHDIDKKLVISADDPDKIKDLAGMTLDLRGNRAAAVFTWRDLENTFGSDPVLLSFMRGKKATHPGKDIAEWICRLCSIVPGSLLPLFWEAG